MTKDVYIHNFNGILLQDRSLFLLFATLKKCQYFYKYNKIKEFVIDKLTLTCMTHKLQVPLLKF